MERLRQGTRLMHNKTHSLSWCILMSYQPRKRKRQFQNPRHYLIAGLVLGAAIMATAFVLMTLIIPQAEPTPTQPAFVTATPIPAATATPFTAQVLPAEGETHILSADISRDGRRFALAIWDDGQAFVEVRELRVRGNLSSAARRVYAGERLINDVIFSPAGDKLVILQRDINALTVVNVATGDVQLELIGQQTAAFSPNGQWLAIAGLNGGVRLLNARTLEFNNEFEVESGINVVALAFSPDSNELAGAVEGNDTAGNTVAPGVYVWDATSGDPIARYGVGERINELTFNHDGTRIALAAGDNVVIIDRENGELAFWPFEMGRVQSVAFNPTGDWLAAAGGMSETVHGIRAWRWYDGTPVAGDDGYNAIALEGHNDVVYSIAFTPDGNYLLSAAADGSVRLWDYDTGEQVSRLQP